MRLCVTGWRHRRWRGDGLMARTEPAQHDALSAEPGTRHFDRTGRPMKGWLIVDAEDADLRRWVDRGIMYACSLPPK